MSDVEAPVVESQQPIEVQREAEKMGWIPPTRFKGDPSRFVDADIYICLLYTSDAADDAPRV